MKRQILLFLIVIFLQITMALAKEEDDNIRLKIDSILFLFDKNSIEIKVSLYNGTSGKVFVSDKFSPFIINFYDRKQDMMPEIVEEHFVDLTAGHSPSKLSLKEIKTKESCSYTLETDMPEMKEYKVRYLFIKVSYSLSDINFLQNDMFKHKQKEIFIGDILSLAENTRIVNHSSGENND